MFYNILFTTIASWVLFGLIVGYLVHAIDPQDVKGGVFGTTILGILGAIIGGFLSVTLLGSAVAGLSLQGLITTVAGGLILAFCYRLLFRESRHIKTKTTEL